MKLLFDQNLQPATDDVLKAGECNGDYVTMEHGLCDRPPPNAAGNHSDNL